MTEANNNFNAALAQTKTAITSFFDSIDKIDRRLYGKRMSYFMWGVVSVIIIAPILDYFLEVPHDRLTYLSTLIFLMFLIIVIFSWISSWRDDNGNWTLKRAQYRLTTYYETLRDAAAETKTNSGDELLYRSSKFLVFFALSWKSFQNLSVFIRKPLEHFSGHDRHGLRHFEKVTHQFYWIPLLVGIGTIYYLYRKNPQILKRIKSEVRQLFGKKSEAGEKYHNEVAKINTGNHVDLVINTKEQNHMELIVTQSKSTLFNDFITALQNWNPQNCHYEYEFQDKLYRYLCKVMPEATIETERPIGDVTLGNKGRADMIINDTILIEMKRDTSAGAIQRANGQMMQYSRIWKDKGPVILLLCDYEYGHAKLSYTPTMEELYKLDRAALTIVAKSKVN